MFKTTLIAAACTLALSNASQANISLTQAFCSGNQMVVQVNKPDSGRHTVNVYVTSSGKPQERQSQRTSSTVGQQTLYYTFSSSLMPFGIIQIFDNDLQIDKLYHGCPWYCKVLREAKKKSLRALLSVLKKEIFLQE